METHLTGAFPRSEALIELTRAAAHQRVEGSELEAAYAREVSAFVGIQAEAGLDLFVDGQLNWRDLFRPFSEVFAGIRAGALTRWFDNNTFYRKPIIVEKIRYTGTGLGTYFKYDRLPADVRRKVILPGPYTFAVMSQNLFYSSIADLIDDIAHSLRDIVRDLRKMGRYDCFQFNEPSICFKELSDSEITMVSQAYDILVKGSSAKTILHTYFGDIAPVIETVLDLPTDSIGVDFYATSIDSLAQHDFTKGIACGCIDARNSLLESPDALKKITVEIEDRLNPRSISIVPNCDLDFLPQSIAMKKLALLTKAKDEAE